MKFAIIKGQLTHISKVEKGTIGREFGYNNQLVIACGGKVRQYFKPLKAKTLIRYAR
ncbi:MULTISPECIES: hypothetical protein [Coprobacillaceae]|uniref:hypothetical protein n=1 Tax=Coprobacillaceae TaxID=2810280 RepID=UPI0018F4824B|nr:MULTISPECIES: hypothetical protein [Coprobacillaceae]